MNSIANPKMKTTKRKKNWGALLDSQHFGGRGACWSFRMGIREIHKQVNYSHEHAKTKQQVG
jgi:hypothetical protein